MKIYVLGKVKSIFLQENKVFVSIRNILCITYLLPAITQHYAWNKTRISNQRLSVEKDAPRVCLESFKVRANLATNSVACVSEKIFTSNEGWNKPMLWMSTYDVAQAQDTSALQSSPELCAEWRSYDGEMWRKLRLHRWAKRALIHCQSTYCPVFLNAI